MGKDILGEYKSKESRTHDLILFEAEVKPKSSEIDKCIL